MQTGDGHKGVLCLTGHDGRRGLQRGADHLRRNLINTPEGRRITTIQPALSAGRAFTHVLQQRGSMESQQLRLTGLT